MFIYLKKSTPESIEEELGQERAEVLARAGNRLARDLERLEALARLLEEKRLAYAGAGKEAGGHPEDFPEDKFHPGAIADINDLVIKYNRIREEALLSAYYLLVTREALGLRNHKWVEEYYPIPGKKSLLITHDG